MTPPKLGSSASSERSRPSALSFWQSKVSQSDAIAGPSSSPISNTSDQSPNNSRIAARRRAASPSSPAATLPLSTKSSSMPPQTFSASLNRSMDPDFVEKEKGDLELLPSIGTQGDMRQPFSSALEYQQEESSGSGSSQDISPWNSQSEWAKYESFVHPLDILPTEEENEMDEDDTEELQDISEQNSTPEAKRGPRQHKVPYQRRQRGGSSSIPDADASFTWHSSSDEEDESEELDSLDSSYTRNGLQALKLGSPATTPPNLEYDTFYDAQAGPSTLLPLKHPDGTKYDDNEPSWLNLSPQPQYTSTSSSTLRQDVANRDQGLQHQGSSSTLLGVPESATQSRISKKRSPLPPVGPSPNMPLPPPPPPKDEVQAKENIQHDDSNGQTKKKAEQPTTSTGAVELGPSGTIRGRPRGATVGAVPGGKVEIKQRVRPRSMLSNEIANSGETAKPVTSSSTSSASRSRSPAGDHTNASSLLVDGEITSSQSSLGMARTPSDTGNSSSIQSSDLGHRSRSESTASLIQQVQYTRPKSHASFVIAVVGHRGAGKSTVIKKGLRQFGLSKPNVLSEKITSHSTICIVDHEQRTIEVLEMDASVLLGGPSKRFAWPKFLPRIDAVILCYDASQIASFRGMSELLENFAINSLSTVMLACKSEISPKAVDPYYASDMAAVYNVGLAECSVQSEEGKKRMRDCFSFLVKEVAKGRAVMAKGVHVSQANKPTSQEEVSRSEFSLVSQETVTDSNNDVAWKRQSAEGEGILSDAATNGTTSEGSKRDTFVQKSIQKAQMGLQSAKTLGGYVSIDELWDKLFYAAVSGNDERYLLMFMVFYRGFVQPLELLQELISRFNALSRGEKTDGVMIRFSLMRLTTMLGDWMREYPGDLSGAETYPKLYDFFQSLLGHSSTMHVAAPLQPLLEIVKNAKDYDAAWSRNQDSDKPRSVGADVPPVKPTATAPASASATTPSSSDGNRSRSQSTSSSYNEGFVAVPRMMMPYQGGGRHRSASDLTASSDGQTSGTSLSGSSQAVSTPSISAIPANPASLMNATGAEQKALLRSISNALFDVKEDVIAMELTRIEWDLFSAVGSRDLLRHILVSKALRSPDSPVAKSIAHFNYISYWVCSMILAQSKTKQRARMLEKFMEIGGILRRINNYNTLHAVLAGLGNASIHRLKNTRELLNGKPVIKTYQSLARLMGSDRSFAAYRLALENSDGRTIPYLGVHLQDILSLSDGNPSKRASDGLIHWRKFSLMDAAVMTILRCQQYQEPLRESPNISKLILNLPVMDEDVLYQRSLQVEPRQNNGAAGSAGSRMIKQFFNVDA